ncbi:MAG: hypothetical protein DME59_17920 [Verrucomicrobia bacterium]|nr:MAG: hypothetical protein DME59_17920 [Verrucomicrobiota bacterium]
MTYEQCVVNLVSVLRCICRVITIFALCCAIGLHWIALQSLAWTTMVIDYSKREPLCQAIAQTFDGAHPCSLCKMVNKAKSTERKSDLQPLTPKIDMICARGTVAVVHPSIDFEYASCDFSLSETWQTPPVPPPRSLLS